MSHSSFGRSRMTENSHNTKCFLRHLQKSDIVHKLCESQRDSMIFVDCDHVILNAMVRENANKTLPRGNTTKLKMVKLSNSFDFTYRALFLKMGDIAS